MEQLILSQVMGFKFANILKNQQLLRSSLSVFPRFPEHLHCLTPLMAVSFFVLRLCLRQFYRCVMSIKHLGNKVLQGPLHTVAATREQ